MSEQKQNNVVIFIVIFFVVILGLILLSYLIQSSTTENPDITVGVDQENASVQNKSYAKTEIFYLQKQVQENTSEIQTLKDMLNAENKNWTEEEVENNVSIDNKSTKFRLTAVEMQIKKLNDSVTLNSSMIANNAKNIEELESSS